MTLNHVAGCMPEFIDKLVAVTAAAAEAGVHIRWTSGLRTWEEQSRLYSQGRDAAGRILDPHQVVTFAPPGSSFHNFGLAADFVLLKGDTDVEWSGLADLDRDGVNDWLEVGRCAEAVGCEWGGRWKKLIDLPHVQWTAGLDLATVRSVYLTQPPGPMQARTLEPVWQAVRTRAAGGIP